MSKKWGSGPKDAEWCPYPSFDTTVVLAYPQDYTRIDIWSPHPWEPGVRLFAMTWPTVNPNRRDVGGSVVLDTLPDGCWILRTPALNGPVRTYAYDSALAAVPIPLTRGIGAFVSGYYDVDRQGCHELPVLRLESVSFGL